VTLGEATDTNPALAAHGRRLAFARASNAPDLFELDVKSGSVRQITATSCLEDYPQLSPDGRTLLFSPIARARAASTPSASMAAGSSR
jgi:Tol biopolymer transport system component